MLILSLLILLTIDTLSFITISRARIVKGKFNIKILKIVHLILSLYTWILLLRLILLKSDFGDIRSINLMLQLGFVFFTVWIPRIVLIVFSNLGFFLKKKHPAEGRFINSSAKGLSLLIMVTVVLGTFWGRFNFQFEEIEIKYKNLPPALEGFTIVHLSDMHLSSFYKHEDRLLDIMEKISYLEPDIIVNTGDFVTITWNELAPFTQILSKAKSKYGNYAIPGNHDAGTYHPYYNETDRLRNVAIIDSLLDISGYNQLKDSYAILDIDSTSLKVSGVITLGTIPDIIFGDLEKALGDKDVDFTLLLSHDPNHWYKKLKEHGRSNLTLSGHTHGMQFGIRIGKFKWSPVSRLYPAWNGLYGSDDNYLYVNRGLGTISLPSRIGMPPEITIITLRGN